ncbi:MAG: ribosome assembly factor SBDS, partial [Nanoarchaeota archaeon]|nr:ribosome assembly factor SBDS [Nanoarchaeota archaeon]
MVDIDKAVVARIKKQGKTYELLVDSQAAYDYRKGKSISIRDIIAVDEIFTEAKKGIKPTSKELEQAFGTSDKQAMILDIIKHGDIPISAQQLHTQREDIKKQLITKIHRYTIDSRTGLPHPPQRI